MGATNRLSDEIVSLIMDEQERQQGRFIHNMPMETYLDKLGTGAEIVSNSIQGRCRGFVAYYCNDYKTKTAFITLVLVDQQDRGLGLGKALTDFVLNISKLRGFTSCQLEVKSDNMIAYSMYVSQGFEFIEERGESHLLGAVL
ncbi:MAG: GNAT family N-acetyltransferase [Desulfuromonadales bacterium]